MAHVAAVNVNIRLAKKEDMIHVFEMIKNLAEFEQMGNQVQINESNLIRDGFETSDPAFFCYVAEDDRFGILGYALYYTCYSTWLGKSIFLEDLFVHPNYRKLGIGKQLFFAVAKVAYDSSQRLDFHVLSWNPAVKFYTELGATDLTETEKWHLFRLNGNTLNNLHNTK